ncbi:MAG: hypothetical protein JRG74_10595 [Deltaproteobacteria bacterium]|nr:hypothetical protein [Deltaproteobacteria bacterium]
MRTLSRTILVLTCLLSLIGLSGCEQAEEAAKKAGGELMTQAVDKAQQAIGELTGNTGESEDEGKKEKEDTESAKDEGEKEDAESAEEKANEEGG